MNQLKFYDRYDECICDDAYIEDYFEQTSMLKEMIELAKERYIFIQSLNIKDKNNSQIYEDDIVEYDGSSSQKPFKVTKSLDGKSIILENDDERVVRVFIDSNEAELKKIDNIKIIGNIYENPDLLK